MSSRFFCCSLLVQKRLRQGAISAVTFCANNLVFQMPLILLDIGSRWLERRWLLAQSSFLRGRDGR